MDNLYILVSISAFFHPLETQYINIWSDNMDTNNEWIGYNDFSFKFISDKCILSPCSCVTANRNGVSYIEKNTNITIYSSIQLQLDITAYGINQTDYCQIWYNYDNTRYIKYSELSNGKYTNLTVNFPQVTTANILVIKLQVIGNNGTCYFDNAILKGNIRAVQKLFSTSRSIPILWILIITIIVFVLTTCLCCVMVICEVSDAKNNIESVQNETSKNNEKTNIQSVQNVPQERPQHHSYPTETETYKLSVSKLERMLNGELENGNEIDTTANNRELENGNESEFVSTIKNRKCSTFDGTPKERPQQHYYPTDFGPLYAPKYTLSVSKLERMLNGDECSSLDSNANQPIPNTKYEMYSQYTSYQQYTKYSQ